MHESGLRKRALTTDGFVFVLDPTKGADTQREALDSFCQESRQVLDVRPGEPLPLPVAVCLTKLDLLPSRTRLGERGLEWLAQLRSGPRDVLDTKAVHARSDLARGLVGEDDDVLLRLPNQNDLRDRAFAPFGILEPVRWLIHMHGYDVFR